MKKFEVIIGTCVTDGERMEIEDNNDMKRIDIIAKEERGKPYRTGFSYSLADTEHRGHYACDVIRDGESNQDEETKSADGSDAFASFTYYVRVKGNLFGFCTLISQLLKGEFLVVCKYTKANEQTKEAKKR